MFLNNGLSGLKPKDLTITAVGTKTRKFISFRTTSCYVQVLSNTVEIDFGLEMRDLKMRVL